MDKNRSDFQSTKHALDSVIRKEDHLKTNCNFNSLKANSNRTVMPEIGSELANRLTFTPIKTPYNSNNFEELITVE